MPSIIILRSSTCELRNLFIPYIFIAFEQVYFYTLSGDFLQQTFFLTNFEEDVGKNTRIAYQT